MVVADGGVVYLQNVYCGFLCQTVFVYTDNALYAGVDTGLRACGGFFNAHLWQTGFDGFRHATHAFNFLNECPTFVNKFVGQRFHVVRACPRVNFLTDLSFFLNVNLCVAGDTGGEVGRQGNGFVQCVGVQGLGMSQGGCHSFDTGTSHIVERVLLGQ
ncbi:hypothetical protein Barb6_03839 [Bacteroidales bacterium Barb6]|nr:hypothetical protein Barb6_03839 [Bacteroidales bacterium Barb6]